MQFTGHDLANATIVEVSASCHCGCNVALVLRLAFGVEVMLGCARHTVFDTSYMRFFKDA